ncbi:MAG: PD-(D/E)XK nuclease family protein [Muribaculaceae bacterium]|nr:PD-(D/E)XK nuclease family protein [Muribaculaceae bacterium]
MAEKFLEQIARNYTAPERIGSLGDILFIMPNKRSGMFLKHYIQKHAGNTPVFMPRFATMQRLASSMLRIPEASRNELLFMLYNAYIEEVSKAAHQERPTEFDRFIFWGDMILSDYDLIDKSLADPAKLYANLSDLHDLQADYLTDEQKEVITRIWGPTNMTGQTDSFWFPSGKELAKTDIVRKFVSLWEILGPMYFNLRNRLNQAGMSTPGILIRKAAELLRDSVPESMLRKKFVFVGLSDVSTAELSIMESLNRKGIADFFWDIDLPLFEGDDTDNPASGATAMIRTLARKYPMPDDFSLDRTHVTPEINIFGIPSTVGMAKGAAGTIRTLLENGNLSAADAIETAVVLPDPSQLMPFLLGLPQGLPGLNVTMALPYADTTFATLLRTIILLQNSVRRTREGTVYYMYEQVLEILQHPHISIILPDKIDIFRQKVIDSGKRFIDGKWLAEELPELEFIFNPINNPDSLEDTCEYLRNLLTELTGRLGNIAENYHASGSGEIEALEYLSGQIDSLEALIRQYGVAMKESTFLHLFERILNARPINLEGTPLSGMQVMGVLETRCLDFDNIIYMSLNEKVFPRRDYVRTMIPNTLRRGYGLPTIQHSESFYSYYFFRSLSRASVITLFYDSRTPGSSTGEMSRFLTRLLYLPGDARVKLYRSVLENSMPPSAPIEIAKTPAVKARLNEYLKGGSRSLSASSLKNLFHCPLRFYLQNVNRINYEDEPRDYLNAAAIGSIFHDTMQFLFRSYEGSLITCDIIDSLMSQDALDKAFFESLTLHADYRPGTSDEDMRYEYIVVKAAVQHQIRCLLSAEKDRIMSDGDFTYIKGEETFTVDWDIIKDKLTVNFLMIIDRIDRLAADHLRFIDYKTGGDKTGIGKDINNLFEKSDCAGILQLMIYAEAYHDTKESSSSIDISLINISDVVKSGHIDPVMFNGKRLPPCPDFPTEFREIFNERMEEFFLKDTPIRQTENVDNCRYCPFNNICNRQTTVTEHTHDSYTI